MALPVLEAARRRWPEVPLVVSARSQMAPLLERVSDVFIPHGSGLGPVGLARVARRLAAHAPDLALVLPRSFETALCVRWAGIPQRCGLRGQGRSLLLTHPVEEPPGQPRGALEGRAKEFAAPSQDGWWQVLATAAGGPIPGPDDPARRPRWVPRADDAARAATWRAGRSVGGPWAVLAPGAAFGASKLWEPAAWAALAAGLRVRGIEPILAHAPGEEHLGRAIAGAAGGTMPVATLDLCALAALIEGAAVFVGTDAGPRWLAAAVGTPAVCLMGPNDPRLTDLPLGAAHEVLRRQIECSPCLAKRCGEGHHDCMAGIRAEQVLAAVDRVQEAAR